MTNIVRVRIAVLMLLVGIVVSVGPIWIGYQLAYGDTGAAVAPEDLAREVYRGVTSKDWFLAAGAALMLVVMGVRWLLAKKWPSMGESDVKGVLITAALAGFGGLANAWLADERLASSVTLLGAVKVWAAAVFAYVTSKKLLAAAKAKES